MKRLMQKIISMGADFSTRKALKSTLRFLGVKPENIDRLYMELKNDFYRDAFMKTSPKYKIVFLPQCLRNSNCKTKLTKFGYVCNGCGNHNACKAYRIKSKAESLGYRVFITPGGSMVLKIIKKLKPRAILGVACMKEIVMAMENLNIPGHAVELTRDGCVNTDVKISEILRIL
ncbi:MAG: DUF116 domain-containing protein [Candidatus Aenigmatarchaeota archaeon]|nr:MAG: DUF116 domain-containing protein [Candidatus Aenigmarchaeota archaeon]